jgi:hypothetical protein
MFGHIPTWVYLSYRSNESFVPKQQRNYYMPMVYGWWKNE